MFGSKGRTVVDSYKLYLETDYFKRYLTGGWGSMISYKMNTVYAFMTRVVQAMPFKTNNTGNRQKFVRYTFSRYCPSSRAQEFINTYLLLTQDKHSKSIVDNGNTTSL